VEWNETQYSLEMFKTLAEGKSEEDFEREWSEAGEEASELYDIIDDEKKLWYVCKGSAYPTELINQYYSEFSDEIKAEFDSSYGKIWEIANNAGFSLYVDEDQVTR
jgi:hypothetical protein